MQNDSFPGSNSTPVPVDLVAVAQVPSDHLHIEDDFHEAEEAFEAHMDQAEREADPDPTSTEKYFMDRLENEAGLDIHIDFMRGD